MSTWLLSLCAYLLLLASSSLAQEPVFSFWGNLTWTGQAKIGPHDFRRDLAPLPENVQASCCAVQPGQPLTLIRNGQIIGTGQVGPIIAGDVPRAGDNRVVYFHPQGLPDSVQVPSSHPFPHPNDSDYDLYVIGEAELQVLPPLEFWEGTATPWPDDIDLAELVPDLVKNRIISPLSFYKLTYPDPLPEPDFIADWMDGEMNFFAFSLPLAGDRLVDIQVCQWESRRGLFLRLVGAGWSRPVNLPGELDFILRLNGALHLVMRSGQAETGAWGYFIYRLVPDELPEKVHSDGTWST